MDKTFFKKYYNLVQENLDNVVINDLIKVAELAKKTAESGKKLIIAGNGGSAAMASHVSVDFTKVAKVRAINFNEADLITCFSNDYGYENWVKQALKFYCDNGDLVILISASGNSKNMINAAKYLKKKNNKLITFTGFNGKNLLSKYGYINLNVNSNKFNFIENTHQYWLLTVVDILSKFKN